MKSLPVLSFRWKLVLAMMVVVAGVAGVTLYVTQERVQATYQKLFEDQFKSQIAFFAEKQQLRLDTVMEKCRDICRSVRVIAAMEAAADKEADAADIIYENVWQEMEQMLRSARQQLKANHPPPPKARGPLASRRPDFVASAAGLLRLAPTNMVLVRVVDREGRVLPDPKRVALRRERETGQKLGWFAARAVSELKRQEVGYLAVDVGGKLPILQEVVVTPIVDAPDESGGQTIGALITGFPLPDVGEQTLSDMSHILSGILLEGKLYSKTIPSALMGSLTQRLLQEMKVSKTPRTEFIVPINGAPHRVFYSALNPDSPFPTAYQVGLYSLAAAQKDKRELRWKILTASALVLLGALALSLVISHGLAVPIRELVAGTEAIQSGDFAVKVPVRSRDEIGRLATSFNEMAAGLALKEKYRSVLDLVTDKGVAQELINGSVALGGEQRDISVLFCDIRGFTALTQNMPPAEVIAMLNEHMTILTRVVYEHDGVVDKFVGDLIMAVFGAPRSYGYDAHNAARCALRMIQERTKLNETSTHRIQVGIGVASGMAVAGCMGSSDRLNYTVLGERVNLASRLCGVAGKMEVVIDETTRTRLDSLAGVDELPPLTLKGFSGPVCAFKLLELRSLQSALK